MSDTGRLETLMQWFGLAGGDDAVGLARLLKAKQLDPNERWEFEEGALSPGHRAFVWPIERGQLAVGYAASEGKSAAVEFLAPISDLSAIDDKGNTALIAGAWFGDPSCARAMLAAISDEGVVNAKGEKGETALMVAAREGQSSYVKALLADARCDASLANDNGETAFDLATDEANWGAAALLSPFVSDSAFSEWAMRRAQSSHWLDAFDTPGLHERIPLQIAQLAVKNSKNPEKDMPRTLARVEASELAAVVEAARAAPDGEIAESLARGRLRL